jgi:KDO2-lipid IV(A) lauroyltransferase
VTSRKGLEAPHKRLETTPPRFVEKAAVIGYRSMSAVLAHTPPAISRAVIGGGNQLAYLAWPAKRRFSNVNFGHVLGLPPDHPRVRRLALRAYRVYGDYLVELMRVPFMPADEVIKLIEPLDPLEVEQMRATAPEGGIICTVGHVGNNDAIGAAIAHLGLPLSAVADDSSFPELFDLLKRQREQWSASIIPWRNLRAIFGVLRRRELLALLVDWGYRSDGIPVKLFDGWTTLPAGPATLAAKTRSLIVPIITTRRPDHRLHMTWADPIEVPSADPADLQSATQRIADALARTIGTAPEEWYSFKPMWPATAEEAADLERRAREMQAGRPDPGPNARLSRDPDDQAPAADPPVEAA